MIRFYLEYLDRRRTIKGVGIGSSKLAIPFKTTTEFKLEGEGKLEPEVTSETSQQQRNLGDNRARQCQGSLALVPIGVNGTVET